MDFPNANTGYICGDNSAISKTTNGGAAWTPLSPGASGTYYSVSAPSDMYVYFSNAEGRVYKSTTGGSSWTYTQVHTTNILSISFVTTDSGFAAGLTGAAFKTGNGGASWTPINTFTTNNIWDMSFVNSKIGWFDAYYGTLRKTVDGGVNMVPSFGYTYNFEGISAINEMIAYSCGLSGVLMKTTDGGTTWFMQNSGTTEGLNGMFMLNANTGYVVGSGGKLLKTTDGGGGQQQFINVITPNGGEVYQQGETVNIKWSANGPNNISIDYTTNNGSSWTSIAASVPASNFKYVWTVPSATSTNYKIRITDAGSSLTDMSNNTFTVIPSWATLYKVPDILYLKFNNGSVITPNYALPGNGSQLAHVMGHTIQTGGMFDSALIGGGNTGTTHRCTDSAAFYLPPTGWTIGFWLSNIMLGSNPGNAVYLFGELTQNFRIYYGGSGGVGASDTAIMLRMNGATDVRVPVIKGQTVYIHYVWDPSSMTLKAYKNGALVVSVSQPGYTGAGNGPISIGAHTTFASSLSSGMKMDEFRIYGRALSLAEIQGTWYVTLPSIMVGINEPGSEIPMKYELKQNYPNPFNPTTVINYQLPMSNNVKLIIFDAAGREVVTLVNEKQNTGSYEVKWDASDYSSGVYFYKLEAGSFSETKKMILIK